MVWFKLIFHLTLQSKKNLFDILTWFNFDFRIRNAKAVTIMHKFIFIFNYIGIKYNQKDYPIPFDGWHSGNPNFKGLCYNLLCSVRIWGNGYIFLESLFLFGHLPCCRDPHLLTPWIGVLLNESDCLLLIWGTCSCGLVNKHLKSTLVGHC